MGTAIQSADVKDLRRDKQPPFYDFIEDAVQNGTAYQFGNDGYFVVAQATSLMPRFVVELRVPEIANFDQYVEMVRVMNDRSCGMLWFDSQDVEACDLAWRLRLPLEAGGPLFVSDPTPVTKTERHGMVLKNPIAAFALPNTFRGRKAELGDVRSVAGLVSDVPVWKGGQTLAAVTQHVENGAALLLEEGGQTVGTAITRQFAKGYLNVVSVAVQPDRQNKGIGTGIASLLVSHAHKNGDKLVASMSNQTPEAVRIAMKIGMRPVKQAFKAKLGQF